MNTLDIVALVVAFGLLVLLVWAMLKPERF
jgi:K+-transporting ATPase KdpF subunit